MAEIETILSDEMEIYEDGTTSVKKVYEYEILLENERKRSLNVKAKTLVKLGVFSQETLKKIDFAQYNKITYNKKYKGVYDLYESNTGSLMYVNAKKESDSTHIYEYDVLVIEDVTEEQYSQILVASTYEKNHILKICYVAAQLLLLISVICQLTYIVSLIIIGGELLAVLTSQVAVFLSFSTTFALIALLEISYKKFINKK